ncbi:MAG: sugar ABC transporter ATP-binding protein [Pirellulaceae bacterium]
MGGTADSGDILLHMQGVTKHFGPTRALHRVQLEVRRGEVHALIGENGAGKSTLMKVLSGAVHADSGTIHLDGDTYRPTSPHAGQRAGVAMIYQELNLAPHLSVEDNIMLGQELRRFGLLDRGAQRVKVYEALATLGHPELSPSTLVRDLSVGAQQLVEIARALVMNARLIVFDEPTSSLTQQDAQRLFRVIRKLRDSGIGIVYISHFLEEIREICQRYTVLRDGEVAGTGELAGASEKQIVALMVGRSVDELFPTVPHKPGDVILSLESISGPESPRDVSLELRRGEILGIAGLVGAGRTELLRTVFGLDAVKFGAITVAGVRPRPHPHGRIRAGLGLVSEDRKTEGLAQKRSIADNMTYSRLGPYSRFGWLNLAKRRAAVDQWMQKVQIKAPGPDAPVSSLSGGNQQKVALARVLHQEAEVLLLDEPTRGIDVGTKSEIYRLMGELAAQGKAIIFVSSYLPELLAVCDRIGVMGRGRLREVRPTSDWTEEQVMACAVRSDTE